MNKNKFLNLLLILTGMILYSCSDSIPGDDSAFDPIASLDDVIKYAESIDKAPDYTEEVGVSLYSITAKFIKPDGSIDYEEEAYDAECEYIFVKKIKAEAGKDMPLGVNNPNNKTNEKIKLMYVTMLKPWDEEYLDDEGNFINVHYRGVKKEYQITPWTDKYDIPQTEKPISFKTIWEKAIGAGAPSENTVAVITYNRAIGYTFEIQYTDHKFSFDKNGELIK